MLFRSPFRCFLQVVLWVRCSNIPRCGTSILANPNSLTKRCAFCLVPGADNDDSLFLVACGCCALDGPWPAYSQNVTIWAGPCVFTKLTNQPLLVTCVTASLKSSLTCSSVSNIIVISSNVAYYHTEDLHQVQIPSIKMMIEAGEFKYSRVT